MKGSRQLEIMEAHGLHRNTDNMMKAFPKAPQAPRYQDVSVGSPPALQALNIHGRLKFLHGQKQRQENGGKAPPQLALFAIATPLQPPSILEIRTKNMIFRTKHKLDFTPLACDAK